VVTRFECASIFRLLLVLALHLRTKGDVRRQATGFLGTKFLVDWRRRTVLNISLWQDLDSIYSLGEVPRHVAAAHLPHRLGVATTCGIFCFVGDWRRVMFGSGWHDPRTPLEPLSSGRPGRPKEVDNANGH
jgi:hypothetical protein